MSGDKSEWSHAQSAPINELRGRLKAWETERKRALSVDADLDDLESRRRWEAIDPMSTEQMDALCAAFATPIAEKTPSRPFSDRIARIADPVAILGAHCRRLAERASSLSVPISGGAPSSRPPKRAGVATPGSATASQETARPTPNMLGAMTAKRSDPGWLRLDDMPDADASLDPAPRKPTATRAAGSAKATHAALFACTLLATIASISIVSLDNDEILDGRLARSGPISARGDYDPNRPIADIAATRAVNAIVNWAPDQPSGTGSKDAYRDAVEAETRRMLADAGVAGRLLGVQLEPIGAAPAKHLTGEAWFAISDHDCARRALGFSVDRHSDDAPLSVSLTRIGTMRFEACELAPMRANAAKKTYLSAASLQRLLSETPRRCAVAVGRDQDEDCLENTVYSPETNTFRRVMSMDSGARLEIRGSYVLDGNAICHQSRGVSARLLETGAEISNPARLERAIERSFEQASDAKICHRLRVAGATQTSLQFRADVFIDGEASTERADPRLFEMRPRATF